MELLLAINKAAFVNVQSFKNLNTKFFNDIYYLFKLEFYDEEKIILEKGTKISEYAIIPIEGFLKSDKDQMILCNRGYLLFGEEIYNEDNTCIDYNIKC